jgi:hypothetical protein
MLFIISSLEVLPTKIAPRPLLQFNFNHLIRLTAARPISGSVGQSFLSLPTLALLGAARRLLMANLNATG